MKFFTVFILLLLVHGFAGQQITKRINDGSETSTDEFPWMVSIQNNSNNGNDHVCVGSILSETFIITAARCFHGDHMNKDKFSIRAGIRNFTDVDEKTKQHRSISKIFIHPQYNDTNLLNDLALVQISPPFNYTENVRNISLSILKSFENGDLVTIGWDAVDQSNPSRLPSYLQKIVVQEGTNCTQNPFFDVGTQICTNSTENTCFENNGSPLMFNSTSTKQYELIGVASYHENCTTEGLFTLIALYRDWILQILANSSSSTAPTTTTTLSNAVSTTTSSSTPTGTTTTSPNTSINNAVTTESKLFLVSIIFMLCNFI